MTVRERFQRILRKQEADRIPMMEWAVWWNETTDIWKNQGLSNDLDIWSIGEHLGLDPHRQFWTATRRPGCPAPAHHGAGIVSSVDDYVKVRESLFPDMPFDKDALKKAALRQSTGELAVWLSLDGYFWFPRGLLGIEEHFYAFYDQPELIHMMCEDLCTASIRTLDLFCDICVPDFITMAEDMSYNHGPMLSKELFDIFIRPYYDRLMVEIKKRDIPVIVDSDGDITELIPWFLESECHVDGFLPFERQAGCDINKVRRDHPELIIIGGFDKMIMHLGEDAMRAEFERLMPAMKQGGYIVSVDHQTPPSVDFDTYKIYLRLLREYCEKAFM